MEYSIKDIGQIVGRSTVSLYKVIRKNPEINELIEANSREVGSARVKMYGQPVLDWFLAFYKVEFDPGRADDAEAAQVDPEELQAKIKRLRKTIKRLKAENERLLFENDRLETDNQRLLSVLEKEQEQRQGLLLGLFSDKKIKLLPDSSPKRHWWNKK